MKLFLVLFIGAGAFSLLIFGLLIHGIIKYSLSMKLLILFCFQGEVIVIIKTAPFKSQKIRHIVMSN